MTPQPQVHGVLFDIDETLVDLQAAMGTTLRTLAEQDLPHFTETDWAVYQALFAADPQGFYDQYLAGDLSFAEQRIRRLQHAQVSSGLPELDDDAAEAWNATYESVLPRHFQAFDDVVPLLDELDARGIPFGAVSNNVHDYQRAKLDAAGLQRIGVLVGIDTVGVAKPDPAIFLEGARRLGTEPAQTFYVGDNRRADAEGAADAGLRGVWLDRPGNPSPVRSEADARPLRGISRIGSLTEVIGLVGA
ncbi:HAD family hydrolase [Arthrobacter sp. zg-ZUI100]|uniref:HAD family hydrolase n=1 Tax=Arthrobacter jiangjiafuii TaxID=2817475 RepID=UPI001AED1DDB|nr:HAD family hydrolase [Arthrobacter jiangjiafuii]MBP3035881.1 HAD family hydrolase [Arthrobacter jiangjiafuii]